jgi:hypothetical protein
MSRLEQATAAVLCSAALLVSGCSKDPSPGARRFNVRAIVVDCYKKSIAEVFIDGTQLALTPAPQRDDSIGACYDRSLALGARAQVRIRSQGREHSVELIPNEDARFLLISPDHAPYAELSRNAPLLD